MSTLAQMESDLTLLGMNNILTTDLQTLINKVNREEVEAHNWSFLYSNVIIWGVAPYSTGTITVTQGSNTISGDGTNLFTPAMAGMFLSVGPTLTTPVIIDVFLDSQTLQLTTAWEGPSQAGLGFSIYPLYYDIFPIRTPLRVRQIDTLQQTSQAALARIDPSRVSTGGDPSLRWAQGPWTNDNPPHYQIELWPRPSTALPYIIDGKLGPQDMLNPNDNPQVPSAVIEAKAAMYMCRAAFASTGNPKWLQMSETYKADYTEEIDKALTEDRRRKVTLGLSATGEYTGGVNLGEDYWSIHDAWGPPGNP